MNQKFLLCCVALALAVSCRQESPDRDRPVVLFDTDMGNDVDDALALKMLLEYDREGRIDLKGVTISKSNPHAVEFVDGFCRFYGYGDIPLGYAYDGVTPDDNAYLLPTLAAEYEGRPLLDVRRKTGPDMPEGYLALRQWLAGSEDGSVLLIATGPLTNIGRLLDSEGDGFSPLDGVELVKKKVKSVHLMSGWYGTERPEWNVLMDIPASQTVYSKCPVPLVTSGWEVGAAVRYPHESILEDFGDPAANPLSVAYMAYMEMPYDRECWDLTTVLDAIEPELQVFGHSGPGRITVDDRGVTRFTADPEGSHAYLVLRNPDVAVSALVERVTGRPWTGAGMTLLSPDARTRMEVGYASGQLSYTLFRDGVGLFTAGPFRMEAGDRPWAAGDPILEIRRDRVDEEVRYTVPRKYDSARNTYHALTLDFGGYAVEFRAYDHGVAYRFAGKTEGEAPVNEAGRYSFPKDYGTFTQLTGQLQNWFEENYTEAPLSALDRTKYGIEPVLVDADGVRLLLADADTYDYAGSCLRPDGIGFDLVFADYPAREELLEWDNKLYATQRKDYIVHTRLDRTFPWRVVGVFDRDTEILGDDLIYLLSRKTEEDYSWIRPGKALWDWWNDRNIIGVDFDSGVNTDTYLYLVDYAAAHHLEYVLIDEGWSERNDLLTLNPATDIPRICSYAAEKGVGICLWAKWINLDRQMEEAFRMMAGWGVKGVKIDFMDRNDARMVNFYERVAQVATRYRMLVDFHGAYPNEGMRAAYPNLMTREGVVGLEYNKMRAGMDTPRHELLIPFIRQWVGPMDFTPGAMLNAQPESHRVIHERPMAMGTRCHQLAMYVIYESPLQMVSDSPSLYDANADCLPFIEQVPTVWYETRPLWGDLGRKVALARRHDGKYYIGAMLSGEAEEEQIDLGFLPEGTWKMTCWSDGPNASRNAEDRRVSVQTVDRNTILPVWMARNGGWAAILEKIK